MSTENDDGLIEISQSSESVYAGHFLQVFKDIVKLPSGNAAPREYIKHPGAAVIVAELDDGGLVVERQYRFPMGRVMLEFPAGKLDPREDPMVCAQRELTEETGYSAREWAKAGVMHNAIAYSDEVIHIFFARGLSKGKAQLDAEEFLEVDTMSLQEMLSAASKGELTDAKTLTALLWMQNVRAGLWQLDWTSY
jgi:ADP-ribose pyrophosphatase